MPNRSIPRKRPLDASIYHPVTFVRKESGDGITAFACAHIFARVCEFDGQHHVMETLELAITGCVKTTEKGRELWRSTLEGLNIADLDHALGDDLRQFVWQHSRLWIDSIDVFDLFGSPEAFDRVLVNESNLPQGVSA